MESENEEKREPIINDIIYLSKWEWLRHGARAYLCDRKERGDPCIWRPKSVGVPDRWFVSLCNVRKNYLLKIFLKPVMSPLIFNWDLVFMP